MNDMTNIVVASGNPVKINAVKAGFQKIFPLLEFHFKGIAVPSNVQEQPMDDETTILGAMNRVENARDKEQTADFWVGIEGGVEISGDGMQAFAWVVIRSGGTVGKARTAAFFLPEKVRELVESGKELGEADDIVFGHSNSKQKNGASGLLTGNIVDRTALYTQAVILALIPFRNPDLY